MDIKLKEFKPTSWAIDNKISIFFLTIVISIFGIISYNRIPKEQFPDIVIPTILVNTVYPGSSPEDIENLITRPLEKNIKSINGVKKISSNSVQDFSVISVEFVTNIDVADAKRKVKDAVDKTKSSLPNNLPYDPTVMEIDISEFPIMQINLSGDLDLAKLKQLAEMAQDKIEALPEITRVDIIGALDREININVDMYKMQAASVTFYDIETAVSRENVTISGGSMDIKGMKRSMKISGEFKNIETIKNIVFKSGSGAIVKLKEIAEIKDTNKERESFARANGQNVVTLNIIKKSGQNLLKASDEIKAIIDELQNTKYPKNVEVTINGDQSKFTRSTLEELNNTIIIGFILVTIVLMFFMGLTNAIFVAFSVPLSMAIAYIVMPAMGYTMNMLVMFSFIFALGIVVDDAIVVIENIHRIFYENKGKMTITEASKYAAGEVFVPILSGTLTTLAPFFPLVFWPGVTGKFMHFIPVVLIITLFASLIVAYIINPIFAVSFMSHKEEGQSVNKKKVLISAAVISFTSLIFYAFSLPGIGNFLIFIAFSVVMHNFYGKQILLKFQHRFIPQMMNKYEKVLRWALAAKRPQWLFGGMFALLFISLMITGASGLKVVFFPNSDPQYIYTYITTPVGTNVNVTDSITELVEKRVNKVLGQNNPDVESIIANVALGASENTTFDRSVTSHKGKVTISFAQFSERVGTSTVDYLDKVRDAVKDIKGAQITVDQNKMGPPSAGKPINIEISGDNIDELIKTTGDFKTYVESLGIKGIENLKSDFDATKPEIIIQIDRERANREGISSAQVGMEIRTAVLGKEISKYRDGEEQYPIQLRYNKDVRENINRLMDTKITYRDMTTGLLRQIPLSSVAKIEYTNTYGAIHRKNVKRVITLSSNVLSGYNANEINQKIIKSIPSFNKSEYVDIKLTGEQEDQKEVMQFLSTAMLLALFLILFILITQFNSTSKPLIILAEVLFSIIGVLLGFVIFDMDISIVMTGLGIVALAGIVVRNGILLVEFTDVLRERGYKTREAIIQAGKTRITPVILTATATILGLIPLAIGLKFNFETLFTELNPHIGFGGDITSFFSPLAWTIIFGLSFATFLTLVLIPVMYYLIVSGKIKLMRAKHRITNK
jgi:multidrug efflux pump subunit AcrB